MADAYRVKIDLEKLRVNASYDPARPLTIEEAKEMLADNFFVEQADGTWICEEISLAFLGKDEIVKMVQIS